MYGNGYETFSHILLTSVLSAIQFAAGMYQSNTDADLFDDDTEESECAEDWDNLRDPSSTPDQDEMDMIIDLDRKQGADYVAKSWARHRVMLQAGLQGFGVDVQVAMNASFGHGTLDDAFSYIGGVFKHVYDARAVKRYKPLNWCDSDFWYVITPWARRIEECDPLAASPPVLLYLLEGTRDDTKRRLKIALTNHHPAQMEFLMAHGIPLPLPLCEPNSIDMRIAQESGIYRYQVNVMLIKSTLQAYFPTVLAALVMLFLSPMNAQGVAPNGYCLCQHCARLLID